MNFILRNYRTILADIILTAGGMAAFVAVIHFLGIRGRFEFHRTAIFVMMMLVISRHLHKNKIYWFIANAIIFLIANATIAIQINAGLNVETNTLMTTEALVIAIANVILAIPNSFSMVLRCSLSFLLATAFSLFVLLFWAYYFAEHTWLTPIALLSIMQTNHSEAFSYATAHCSIGIVISAVIGILFTSMFTIGTAKYGGGVNKSNKIISTLIVLFIFTNLYIGSRMIKTSYLTSPFYTAKIGLKEYYNFAKLRKAHNSSISVNAQKQDDHPGVYVLVIGESGAKEHMQVYGYSRENTPWLKNKVENGDAILFQKAFSCHTLTVPVLSYALTEKNQYNRKKLEECSSLIDNLNSAGYKTIWLSNQVQFGAWDTPIRVIADSAKEKIFINHHIGETTDTDYCDGELIKHLDEIDIEPNTFIVIHLMGCHWIYSDRYPNSFNIYGNTSDVDTYDNSIQYNDYVVENIFNKVSTVPNFKCMLYFSDHGEDTNNQLFHNADKFTPTMAKIPFYMIFSDDYEKEQPDRYQAIKQAANHIFTNDLIFNTVLAIMGVKNTDIYEPENDITSQHYDLDIRRFKTLHGQKNIIDIQ